MASIDQLHQPFDRHFREEPDHLHAIDPRAFELVESAGGFTGAADLGYRSGEFDLPVAVALREDDQPTREQEVVLTEAKGRSEHLEPILTITDPVAVSKIRSNIFKICTTAETAVQNQDSSAIDFSAYFVNADDPHEEARTYGKLPIAGGGVFHVHHSGEKGSLLRVTWREAVGKNKIAITSISAPEDAQGRIDFSKGATMLREEFLPDGGGVDFTIIQLLDNGAVTINHKSVDSDPQHPHGMTENEAMTLVENACHVIEPKKEGLIARNRAKLGYSALYAATLAAYFTH